MENRIEWIRKQVELMGAKGVVVGVKADMESAVLAHLAKKAFPNNTLAVWAGLKTPNKRHFLRIMESSEIYHDKQDIEYGMMFTKLIRSTFETTNPYTDLETLLDYYKTGEAKVDKSFSELSEESKNLVTSDMKARFWNMIVQAHAQKEGYVVLNQMSKSRLEMGYFTPQGDISGDIHPLADLTRTEIKEMAVELGVHEFVINEVPTLGWVDGQTDEGDMGVSYENIDNFLNGNNTPEDEKIKELINKNTIKINNAKKTLLTYKEN